MNKKNISAAPYTLPASSIAALISMVDSGQLNFSIAPSVVLNKLISDPHDQPATILKKLNLAQEHDFAAVLIWVTEVIEKMPEKAFAEIQFKKIKTMVGDTAHARLITSWAIESDRKNLGYTYAEMATIDLRQDISKINIPVLILGRTYGTKEASLKIFSDQYKRLPNKSIIIAPTKDFIMYDDPLWFREQVKNFLTNDIKN